MTSADFLILLKKMKKNSSILLRKELINRTFKF